MNENGFNKLSLLITDQLNLQNELLILEEIKKQVLISGDIEKLEDILKKEQTFLLKGETDKNKYQNLLKDLGLYGLSLQQIVTEYDPQNIYQLKSKFDSLEIVVSKLKKINNINNKIVKSRLTVIEQCLSYIGLKENALTYDKEGHY